MRDLIIKCVEAAKGWQFIPKSQLIKIPGSTEPDSIFKPKPVTKDALAAQLIRQIDDSDSFSFSQTEHGRAVVTNSNPKKDQPDRSSGIGDDGDNRTMIALKVIEQSGFIN